MTAHTWVKAAGYRIVGVIASRADLRRALRMRNPPDFFELRLDLLLNIFDELEASLAKLRAPLIITARAPEEGGANNLSAQQRRELLVRFLPPARYVDVELRSANAFRAVLEQARKKNAGRIISFHEFKATPDVGSLRAMARKAKTFGADIFKVAIRTEAPEEIASLIDFITSKDVDLPISAMGIGKLGRESRCELMRHGSVLNYCGLTRATVLGQPSISEIRRWTFGIRRRTFLR